MATRDVALSELNFRGISINAESGSNVVAIDVEAYDSGIIFINKEESGTVTYTLPIVAEGKGKMWWFYSSYAAAIAITSGTGSTLVTPGSATATTLTSAAAVGECAMVFGDGDFYYVFEIFGTWS